MNKVELFNESTLLIVNYCFFFFLDSQDDYNLKYNVGWLLVSITLLNTFINIVIVAITSGQIILIWIKNKYFRKGTNVNYKVKKYLKA